MSRQHIDEKWWIGVEKELNEIIDKKHPFLKDPEKINDLCWLLDVREILENDYKKYLKITKAIEVVEEVMLNTPETYYL